MTEQLARYLTDFSLDRISFDEFQNWFIDYVMGTGVNQEDQPVADNVEGAMAEFTGRHISEDEFKEAVKKQLENVTIVSSPSNVFPFSRRTSSSGQTFRV